MCTCHDRPIDHAFDDDIDQYVVPWRQDSPPARMQEDVNRALLRAEVAQATYAIPPKEATERELLAYLAADKDEQEDQ